MNQTAIGGYIARKRKEQNLTQEQLAEQLGVSNKTISKWENGKCMPDYSIIQKLCETLHVTLPELMDGEDTAGSSVRVYDDEQILDLLRRTQELERQKDILCGFVLIVLGIASSALSTTTGGTDVQDFASGILTGLSVVEMLAGIVVAGKNSCSIEADQRHGQMPQPCTDGGGRRTHKHSRGEALRLHPCCCFVVYSSSSEGPVPSAAHRKKSGPFCRNRTSDTLNSRSAWADGSSKGSRNSSCMRRIR